MNKKNNNNSIENSNYFHKLPVEKGTKNLVGVLTRRIFPVLVMMLTIIFFVLIEKITSYMSKLLFVLFISILAILLLVLIIALFSRRATKVNEIIKRVLDISLSLSVIIMTLPFMLILMILVKIDSKGPIFSKSKRIGKDGKLFILLKFRTFQVNNDVLDDPRVTNIGKFLRRFNFDYYPELLNVLLGDMSLVGPRPMFINEVDYYDQKFLNLYKKVKPGITGLWQIIASSTYSIKEKVKLESYYINNWNIWLDIKILLKTIISVFHTQGF
jgi:lipopolysaccharide/colanic/teichoic acid biosynthesis glycosyltransferase